jgi:DnaJ family protein A protein 2
MNSFNSAETYYSLLGINNNASPDEIKRVYRKLSLELHPDRNRNDSEKLEKYKKITAAYNILSDPIEKAKYDASIVYSNCSLPVEDIFMNMMLNPNDLNNIINNLYFSSMEEMPIHKPRVPSMKSSMGAMGAMGAMASMASMAFNLNNNFNNNLNNNLNSSNKFSKGINNFEFNSRPRTITHKINISLLDAYKGAKIPITIERWNYENNIEYIQEETIYVDIPKGIDNNEIITIKEKGNKLSNSNKGDIEVRININNDTDFERNGIDLIYKKTISLKESLCGFNFTVKYLDGREFIINNKLGNIIPPEFRKIINNLGMTRENVTGDLIIIFNVEYPKTISNEILEKISTLLE